MIRIVEGDLLKAKEDIWGHQVNTLGAMGAGLAKQIKVKYPHVFQEYKSVCNMYNRQSLMGEVTVHLIDDGRLIANLFGQMEVGRGKRQTDYDALHQALTRLKDYAVENNKSVALPFAIGCGLAGGDWKIVYKMIDEVFADYEVVLYKI